MWYGSTLVKIAIFVSLPFPACFKLFLVWIAHSLVLFLPISVSFFCIFWLFQYICGCVEPKSFYYSPPSHWKLRLSPQFSSLIYAAFICHIWMNSTEMAQDKSRSFLLSDEFLPHSWRTFVGWSQPGSLFNWVKHSLRASGFG